MSNKLSVLFVGDVVGEPGMKVLTKELPNLISKYSADFVIVNGENICNGKGVTAAEANELFSIGVDIVTTGNHIWDNWHSKPLLASDDRVLRPFNYPSGNVGKGYKIIKSKSGLDVAIVQIQGRTFMYNIDCPFRSIDYILCNLLINQKIIIVDFHAEATAEKIAMSWHLDGKVTALIGTHTHIQTADACIMPNGTAYITDVGMTGPYNSVVGLDKDVALKRFTMQTAHKFKMAEGDEKICAVHLLIDTKTGQAMKIEPIVLPKFERSIYELLQ